MCGYMLSLLVPCSRSVPRTTIQFTRAIRDQSFRVHLNTPPAPALSSTSTVLTRTLTAGTLPKASAAASSATPQSATPTLNNADAGADILYTGPLTATFRRLKIFSLASLTLSFTLSPFIFIATSTLPLGARTALATTALATSGVSTALVAWCGRPYVATLRRISSPPPPRKDEGVVASHNDNTPAGIEMTTLTLALREITTRVYDPVFLTDTSRPFARWQLADIVQLPPEEAKNVQPGSLETVAETMDKDGNVLGRWIVKWGQNGEGTCKADGFVVKHFNVHEEMLDIPIR